LIFIAGAVTGDTGYRAVATFNDATTTDMAMAKASDYPRLLMVMFPIQLAAFLMTLVRKSIITGGIWHVVYAISLGLNYVYAIFDDESLPLDYWLLATFFCFFRFALNTNKYLLWGSTFIVFFALRSRVYQLIL